MRKFTLAAFGLSVLTSATASAQISTYDFTALGVASIDDVASLDMNGDGFADLIASMQSTNANQGGPATLVAVVYSDGATIDQTSTVTVLPVGPVSLAAPSQILVGDFVVGGGPDVMLLTDAGPAETLTAYNNTGGVAPVFVISAATVAPANTVSIAASDIDGVNQLDVHARQQGINNDAMTTLINNNIGGLAVGVTVQLGVGSFLGGSTTMLVGDFDGIGFQDDIVVMGNTSLFGPPGVEFWFNDAGGIFGLGQGGLASPFPVTPIPGLVQIGAADMDGDTVTDIALQLDGFNFVAINGLTALFGVFPFGASGFFSAMNGGGSADSLVAFGDLDTMSGADLLTTSGSTPTAGPADTASANINLGGGVLSAPITISLPAPDAATSMASGTDINPLVNTNDDILIGLDSGVVWILLL